MRAGQFNRYVTIEQAATGSPSTYGGTAKTWSTFATVWAAIRPMAGKKLMAAQAVQSKINTEITIRYLSGVLPAMRVNDGSTYYDIDAVIDKDMRHVEMLLLCSTGLSEG